MQPWSRRSIVPVSRLQTFKLPYCYRQLTVRIVVSATVVFILIYNIMTSRHKIVNWPNLQTQTGCKLKPWHRRPCGEVNSMRSGRWYFWCPFQSYPISCIGYWFTLGLREFADIDMIQLQNYCHEYSACYWDKCILVYDSRYVITRELITSFSLLWSRCKYWYASIWSYSNVVDQIHLFIQLQCWNEHILTSFLLQLKVFSTFRLLI